MASPYIVQPLASWDTNVPEADIAETFNTGFTKLNELIRQHNSLAVKPPPAPLTSFPWSEITGTPTTLGGYGITDAFTKTASDARYAPIAGPFPWADVTGTPSSLAGYGITDAYTKTASDARFAAIAGPFPWADITGQPTTLGGYGITDAYTKTAADARYAPIAGPFPWADVTGTPTTVGGYGITDVYTKTAGDARYAAIAGPFPWADVSGTPTTIGGYGITDFNSLGDARWAPVAGPFVGSLTGNADTATKLITARNINGVAFDGTADITVTAAAATLTGTTLNATVVTSSLTSVGTLTALTVSGTVTLTAAASKIVPGATSLALRNNADSASNISITDAGAVTLRGSLVLTSSGTWTANGSFTGVTQRALTLNPTFTTGATTEGAALYLNPQTPASSFTMTNMYGLHIDTGVKGSKSTITNQYGLYIENIALGGTLKYAIFTNTGLVRFGDAVTMTSSLTFTTATQLIIPGATAISFRDTANANTNLGITDAGVVTIRAGLTVTAGGLTVSAGGITVTAGGLTVSAGGSSTQSLIVTGNLTINGGGALQWGGGSGTMKPGGTLSVVNTTAVVTLSLTDPGALTVLLGITTGSATLHTTSVALTNNAGAAAGTLLNAPAAGNPTKWIPINDNGTVRNIPAW